MFRLGFAPSVCSYFRCRDLWPRMRFLIRLSVFYRFSRCFRNLRGDGSFMGFCSRNSQLFRGCFLDVHIHVLRSVFRIGSRYGIILHFSGVHIGNRHIVIRRCCHLKDLLVFTKVYFSAAVCTAGMRHTKGHSGFCTKYIPAPSGLCEETW